MEVNEKYILEEVAKGGKVVLDLYLENCPNCDRFAPIFDKVASENPSITFIKFQMPRGAGATEIKKKFLNAGGTIDAPFLIVCDKGELAYRHFGPLDQNAFKEFVLNAKVPLTEREKAEAQKKLLNQELQNTLIEYGDLCFLTRKLPALELRIAELRKTLGMD